MELPHNYIENPDAHFPRVRLSDEVFTTAIESLTIVDVDVVFANREKRVFYLAKRIAKPLIGYWMIGGRMFAGESEFDALLRNVKRETGLEIAPDRCQFIGFNRYLWATRAQIPQDRGTDNLCYTFVFEPTPEELVSAASALDPHEYDTTAGFKSFDAASLEAEGVHEAMCDLYQRIFPANRA